jgi:hypothetical protein
MLPADEQLFMLPADEQGQLGEKIGGLAGPKGRRAERGLGTQVQTSDVGRTTRPSADT